MAAEYVSCSMMSQIDSYDSQNACYEIYDFVMTYVGNRTIKMTLVILFLVGNKTTMFHLLTISKI